MKPGDSSAALPEAQDATRLGSLGRVGVVRWLATRRAACLVTGFYAAFAALVFRAGLGGQSGQLAQGTNVLNSFTFFWWQRRFPIGTWLFPYTDWGQPFPAFTGPTPLTPFILTMDLTVLLRCIEFAAFVIAGVSMYWVVRRSGGTVVAATVAGFYYLVMAGTSQFFEGHLPAMIVVAVAPALLFLLQRFLSAPRWRSGAGAAALLYVIVALGDLSLVYYMVFFGILLAAYTIVRRNLTRRYSRREILTFAGSLGLFVLLMVSWLVPFALGARPEYTTNVVVNILPFSQTAGEPISHAVLGSIQDNSYIFFTYGARNYALGGETLFPLFLLVPLGVSVYALFSRNLDRLLLWLSAMLAAVFATGRLYPGLTQFNHFAYDYVPYFNALPSLFRWSEYAVLAEGVLLGLLLSDLERHGGDWLLAAKRFTAQARRALGRRARSPAAETTGNDDGPTPAGAALDRTRREYRRRWSRVAPPLSYATAAFVVSVVLLQNYLLVARPPGVFVIPASYTASNGFLSRSPIQGDVLEVPFGGVYSNTPWGGVASSPALLTPALTGADTVIFEAGTPYSLAIDQFIGDGLTYGYSRNVTKLLSGLNVEYVVATKYPGKFSQISSADYPTDLSYYSLQNQSGLGAPVFSGGVQTVYQLPGHTGNLSFHPSYIVYFGGPLLLYAILDAPWFSGANDVLIDGSTLGAAHAQFLLHAQAVVATPNSLSQIPFADLSELAQRNAPLLVMEGARDLQWPGINLEYVPWNATGGYAARFDALNANLTTTVGSTTLVTAGFRSVNVTAQTWCPPNGSLVASVAGGPAQVLPGPTIQRETRLDLSSTGFAAAGAENASGPYNGSVTVESVGGSLGLNWTFDANSSVFQYLSLRVTNVSGWNGLYTDVQGNPKIPPVWRIIYNGTRADFPFYENLVPISTTQSRLYAYYPAGGLGAVSAVLHHLGSVSGLQIGIPEHSPSSRLTLTNLTLFDSPPGPFQPFSLGSGPVHSAPRVALSSSALCEVSSLTARYGGTPTLSSLPVDRDFGTLPDPTSFSYSPALSGWGVVLVAQTFHPLWQLTVAGSVDGAHAVANLGLNAWLLNASPGSTFHVSYLAEGYEAAALVGEVGIGAVAGLAAVVWSYRRGPRLCLAANEEERGA